MGEDAQVVLARLEGRVEALTEVVEVRLRTQERDVESYRLAGDNEHRKLQSDIREVTDALRDIEAFRSKLYGIGVGLTLASGTISGLLVAVLTNLNGG